jgi:hypothetical protein
MTGLILEFDDGVTENEIDSLIDDPKAEMGWLRVPRSSYITLIESAQKVRADWLLRDGAEFICETCKSFIIPSVALIRALDKISVIKSDFDYEDFWHSTVMGCLTKPYPMTEEDWNAYDEGKLRHIPFIYDDKNELLFVYESGPQVVVYDEVVFKFRKNCVCDGVYKGMYENLTTKKS